MRRLIQAASGAAVAVALAFGGTQALASPAAPTGTLAAACTSSTCGTACFNKGYTHWSCWNGVCQCSFGPPP
jgi:spore coat protein U-like protein